MYLEQGPFLFGDRNEYAQGKAKQFPDEGGLVILSLEIPADIVHKAAAEWFPLSQGLVQLDLGSGFKELLAAWSEIVKSAQIRSLR